MSNPKKKRLGGAASFRRRKLKAYLIGIPQASVGTLIKAARIECRSISGFVAFHTMEAAKKAISKPVNECSDLLGFDENGNEVSE